MSNTNDFDSHEDVDQNIDQDMDFGEFEEGKSKSLGDVWKSNPLVKFGLIAAAILVVIVLVALFGGNKTETPTSVVSDGNKVREAPGTKEVSPVMREAIEEKNQQRIDDAQKQGISAIPTPIDPPKTLLDAPEDGDAEDPLLRWKQMQEERAKAQREQQLVEQQPQGNPERDAKVQSIVQAMVAQMSDILGKEKGNEMKHMSVFDISKIGAAQEGAAGASGFQEASTEIAPQKPANVLLSAGKIEYAQMMLEANSDIPGPVVAMMASGPFSGGKLIGSFTKQQEYLVIKFNTLVTKKGTSVKINAFAIDPATSLTGVATDVDHRYFQRIILPAAAKFVEGLGEAYAETTTTTSQSSSSTTTSSEDMDTKQELGKAVSEAASQASEVLSEDGEGVESLVIVAAGTPLGILFMDSLTDRDLLEARAGIDTTQMNGTNGQLQNGQQQQIGNPNGLNAFQQLQMGLQNQQFLQQGTMQGYPIQPNGTNTTGGNYNTTTGQ